MRIQNKLIRIDKKKFFLVSTFLFVPVIFFLCFFNGIQTPNAKATNDKVNDCKKLKAVLTEHGYARGQLIEKGPEVLSPTKTFANYRNIQVIETGNKIPLEDGSIIYFSYKIQNLPKDKEWIDGFKILLTFPEIKNPSGEKFTKYQYSFGIGKGKQDEVYYNEHYWSFSNSDPYEMVEGPFTYHLYYKSCLLLEHTFYTYKR